MKFSITNKGNVVQCKWNCNCNHEHYIGTYENALKYFGVDTNNIKSYGNLKNIIIYHQTSQYTIPKLSNELYDILINAMSEHKYWVEPINRENKAFELLSWANENNYLNDKIIYKTLKNNSESNLKVQKRLYMYELWKDKNEGRY